MAAPLWTPAERDRCEQRCAEAGDMPCYDADASCAPCDQCREPGEDRPEPLDPAAVVRELL